MRSRREPSQASGLRILVAFARYSPRVRGSSRRILGYVVTVVGRNFSCEVPSCRLSYGRSKFLHESWSRSQTRLVGGGMRLGSYSLSMANAFGGMPMVEVVAPDGTTELWAAAVAHRVAVAVVQKAVPEGYVARATNRRLPVSPRLDGFRPGEVRKVQP